MRGAGYAKWVASPVLWEAVLFAALLLKMDMLRPVFRWAFPQAKLYIYDRASFLELFLAHLGLGATASLGAAAAGVALAIFVTRPVGGQFRPIVDTLANRAVLFPSPAPLRLLGVGGSVKANRELIATPILRSGDRAWAEIDDVVDDLAEKDAVSDFSLEHVFGAGRRRSAGVGERDVLGPRRD